MAPFNTNERNSLEFSNVARNEAPSSIRLSEIISALSYALDLTEGQPMGHSVRACMIGMRLAQQIGMSAAEQAELSMLQDAMYRHVDKVAPLPLDVARSLHQELLQKAACARAANQG